VIPGRLSLEVVEGDPASCSALGGALRRRAAALRDRRTALRHTSSAMSGWNGPAADDFIERLLIQLAEVEQMAGRLDEAGAALQAYATDLAHAGERGVRPLDAATRTGLVIAALGPVPPQPGPAAVEVATRRDAAVPLVQHQVDCAIGEARAAAHRLRSALGCSRSPGR